MRRLAIILSLFIYFSASAQPTFDTLKIEQALMTLPASNIQMPESDIYIKTIHSIDNSYRTITDTLYYFKSHPHTLLETIYIDINDSIQINPLALGSKLQLNNMLFFNSSLNIQVDSIAGKLNQAGKKQFYQYLADHFDYFSPEEKKLKPKAVRIRSIRHDSSNFIYVDIDIYGAYFLWTIDKASNWKVVKCERLAVY